jgi:protein-S-isoprenylcysteine O-methyltransferase Ste14
MTVRALPDLQLGLLNGWLPLALYFVGLFVAAATFPAEARARLFADPKLTMPAALRVLRLFGQMLMFIYIGLMVWTPLALDSLAFALGAIIYGVGYVCVMVALYHFKHTPLDQVVARGPYRFSRNPQWVGLFLVLVGAAIMTGVWLYLGMVLVVAIIYHQQILAEEKVCLAQYGDGFRAYMAAVPRYFWLV